MDESNPYDATRHLLEGIIKALPKDKESEKVLLVATIAGIIGIGIVKITSIVMSRSSQQNAVEEAKD